MTDRISIIKDIRCSQPHAAHLRILAALAADALAESAKRPGNFRELYDAWLNALSVQELNKRFYTELAHWYFWARTQVQFPPAAPKDDEGFQSIAVIRLLTRLIFVWFIKEKGLVPERLFDAQALSSFLKESPLEPDGCGYYQAVLQNLFFATLDVELGDDEQRHARRRWADTKAVSEHYLVPNIYRFSEQFNNPDQALDQLFGAVPFLNGGLFECLDRELTEPDLKRDPAQRKFATEEKTRSKPEPVDAADRMVVFQKRAIRRTWHNAEWWFAIVDVVAVLTDSVQPEGYVKDLRRRDKELAKGWGQIATPLRVETEGGAQRVNCANTEGLFRIIQSIPSPKAEPFKRWLAQVGYERVDFLSAGQVKAAAVHVRTAFELALKHGCYQLGLPVEYNPDPRKISAFDL